MLLMAGCAAPSSSPAAPPAGAPADNNQADTGVGGGKFTMGFCINAMDEFQSEMVAIYRELCEARNIDVIVTNADGNPHKQLADMESLLLQEPDVIWVMPVDPVGMVPGFQAAIDAGIPTFTPLVDESIKDLTLILTQDQYEIGVMVNEWLDKKLVENPDLVMNVGYIWGALGFAVLNDRYQAFVDGLVDKFPGRVNLLADQTANWSSTEAMALVEDWMQAFPEMNTIVSQSDEMSIGAINALKGANVDFNEFFISSFDGSPNAQNHIREGSMHSTVFYAKRAFGETALNYAERLVAGENLRGQIVDLTREVCFVMTIDNIDELLALYG